MSTSADAPLAPSGVALAPLAGGAAPPAGRLEALAAAVGAFGDEPLLAVEGRVVEVRPSAFVVRGLSPFVRLGDRVAGPPGRAADGEIVRIDRETAVVKPYDGRLDVAVGETVRRLGPLALRPDARWKGRVLDVFGRPLDGAGPVVRGLAARPLRALPPPAAKRRRVDRPIRSGVRAIDVFTPLCAGQRIGIFAGSGVGKTTLLSMLARAADFTAVVVALVGERGREVRDFLEEALAPHRDRSVVIVSTADESPMRRRLAPLAALTVAEHFRDAGEDVLLVVDSATRWAHAARDVALSAGEPPVARGYPPSVFTELPMLLERAGPGVGAAGSITALVSVLVDGDDHNDPVSDAVRGILDGHVVLDRAIAESGRFPAVDLLKSVSRLAGRAQAPDEQRLVRRLRALVARFEDARDLRAMGGYVPGHDGELDQAVALVPKLYAALGQTPADPVCRDAFRELAASIG